MSTITSRDWFLARVDRFQDATGLTDWELGFQATRHGQTIRKVRCGGSITLATMEKVEAFMRDYARRVAVAVDPAPPRHADQPEPEAAA